MSDLDGSDLWMAEITSLLERLAASGREIERLRAEIERIGQVVADSESDRMKLRAELAGARERDKLVERFSKPCPNCVDTERLERLKIWLAERVGESVGEMQRHHKKRSGTEDVWDGMAIAYQRCINQIDAVLAGEEKPSNGT